MRFGYIVPLVKRLLCLIFSFASLPVLANEPGTAALQFLEKVRSGGVDLKPGGDTALQRNTAENKRAVIRKLLEKLEQDLRGGILELGDIREDGGYAAVMVKKVGGFDSSQLQMFPVALVKRESGWIAAPVLASFENAVAGYTVPLKKRLRGLEEWMLRERVSGLEKLISETAERTRKQIKGSIIGEDLEGNDLAMLTDRFVEACAEGNQAAVLGFLGGLGESLPEDWPQRIKASKAAVDPGKNPRSVWRLVVSPDVVRVRVNEERFENTGLVSIACLDPARAGSGGTLGKIEILHFEFLKDQAGRWRIELPSVLLNDDTDELDADDDLDVDLLDRFPKRLRESEPLVGASTANAACEQVMAGLNEGGLRALLNKVDFEGRPKDARAAVAAAAEVWWSVNAPGSMRVPLELGFKEEGMLAVAVFQWFSPLEADRFEMRPLYFKKTAAGWVWAPGVVSAKERGDHKVLSAWVKNGEAAWRLSWRETLLKPSVNLQEVEFGRLASDDEVRSLVGNWLRAIVERNLADAFAQTAWLGKEGELPMKTLRNITYELSVAKRGGSKLAGVYRSASWVAASVVQDYGIEKKHVFIPVVMTSKGARILPGIDLVAGNNRTRKFLNEASFDRIAKYSDEDKILELKNLFEMFHKELKID